MRSGPSRLSRTSVAKLQRVGFFIIISWIWMGFFHGFFYVQNPRTLRIRGGSESLFWCCTYKKDATVGVQNFRLGFVIRILWCLKGSRSWLWCCYPGKSTELLLDLYSPGFDPRPSRPAVVLLHGGCHTQTVWLFFDVSCIDLQQFYKFSVNTPDMTWYVHT